MKTRELGGGCETLPAGVVDSWSHSNCGYMLNTCTRSHFLSAIGISILLKIRQKSGKEIWGFEGGSMGAVNMIISIVHLYNILMYNF